MAKAKKKAVPYFTESDAKSLIENEERRLLIRVGAEGWPEEKKAAILDDVMASQSFQDGVEAIANHAL